MWTETVVNMLLTGVGETLQMTLISTLIGYAIGLPMGIALFCTDKEGLTPNAFVYKTLDVVSNIVRSVPFVILLILLIPITRAIVGRSYGTTATIIPLVVAAAPVSYTHLTLPTTERV